MSWILTKKHLAILDKEVGFRKKVWGECLTVCLAYPHFYQTGMSNLGFQTVYALLNRIPHCLCERIFLPSPADEALYRKTRTPLFSLESQKPLDAFDVVAFSLPFENDYINVLKMLSLGNIPPKAAERNEGHPLCIAGGISVTLNPEPLADFIDAFLIGEGEEMIPEFFAALKTSFASGSSREDLLRAVQESVEGVYCPRFYAVHYGEDGTIRDMRPREAAFPSKIKRRWIADINAFHTDQVIMTPDTEFGDLFVTEISRGCQRGCRFCAAGFVYRPVRHRDYAAIMGSVERGLETGKKIALLGTAISDHPELIPLCRTVLERKGKLSLSSLRVDQITPEMAAVIKASQIDTIAIAPEAGSERLRKIIRKGISEEQIFAALAYLAEGGVQNIRLYFLIGLPGETDDDVNELIRLVRDIRRLSLTRTNGGKTFRRLILSINAFIPKPQTPFQWHPLEHAGTIDRRIRKIKQELRNEPGVRVIHDSPKWYYLQALLSLGDRRVGAILSAVHDRKGNWSQALKEAFPGGDFFVYRAKSYDEFLPWDILTGYVDRSYLQQEADRAVKQA
jgi:radical SAM superfamily enzyme YgiQ (UPF0313 family)